MKKKPDAGKRFTELTGIMARLRGDDGCPWDKEQTHTSLKRFLLEETYELLEAIEKNQTEEMEEELGDLLLQILFHCQIASEQGRFNSERVLSRLKDKLIRRHPHVFSDHHLPDSKAVLQHWVRAKAKEKGTDGESHSLGNLPKAMPALARAQRAGERASHFGLDWPGPDQVWVKIEEELGELKSAASSRHKGRIAEEMGDVFFSLVNLCRFLDIEAEESLSQCINRFAQRFSYIEKQLQQRGRSFAETSMEELDVIWEEAKKELRQKNSSSPHSSKPAIKKRSTKS
jgi:tetrapyrrole methylase family protein/MazG family protein